MAKTQREKLAQNVLKADRIQQTLSSTGWKDIEEIFQDKYNSAMNDLLQGENPAARGAINALTEIMDDISRELKFGERAREKYRKAYSE